MTKFLVWDPFCCTEEDGEEMEAYGADDAAETYADQDCDGLHDGSYTYACGPIYNLKEDGHLICVRNLETQELKKFKVGIVEFEPIWGSHEIEEAPVVDPSEATTTLEMP